MYASAWKEDPFEVMGSRLNVLVWSGGCQPDKAKQWHSVGSKIFSYSNPQVGVEEPLLYRYTSSTPSRKPSHWMVPTTPFTVG